MICKLQHTTTRPLLIFQCYMQTSGSGLVIGDPYCIFHWEAQKGSIGKKEKTREVIIIKIHCASASMRACFKTAPGYFLLQLQLM